MNIVYTESFTERLKSQVKFISKDNITAAKKFKKNVVLKILEIPQNPFRYRKSVYFNDDLIRDLIYKGYTIVFRINKELDKIEIFGFIKYQDGLEFDI